MVYKSTYCCISFEIKYDVYSFDTFYTFFYLFKQPLFKDLFYNLQNHKQVYWTGNAISLHNIDILRLSSVVWCAFFIG